MQTGACGPTNGPTGGQLLAEQRKIDEVEENRLELVADLGTLCAPIAGVLALNDDSMGTTLSPAMALALTTDRKHVSSGLDGGEIAGWQSGSARYCRH